MENSVSRRFIEDHCRKTNMLALHETLIMLTDGVSFKDSSGWEPMLYGLDYFAWFKDSFGDPFGQGDGTLG